jgi:sugar lactone lactonase YvrE
MKAVPDMSKLMIFPACVKARILRAPLASTCRFAAVVLSRLALLALIALGLGCAAYAQTAHLSQSQMVLNTPSPLENAMGLAMDSSGNIYIADQDNRRVLKLTPSAGGFIQSTIGTGLGLPYGIAVDANNNVYIADIELSTLLKETPNGSGGYTQSTIGSDLYDAVSVAVDKQGNVYGVEINNSFIGSLFKETLSGGVYTQSFLPAPGTHGVNAVVVDGNGDLFLNDGWDNEVFEDVPLPGGGGYTTTQIHGGANSLAVDANNNLYIAYYPGYIDKLTPDGSGGFNISYIPTDSNFNDDDFYAINYYVDYFEAAALAVDGNGNVFFIDGYTEELVEESMLSPNFGQVSVGSSSPYPVSMFFTFDTAGTLGSYGVLTQGVPNLDFSLDVYAPGCQWGYVYPAGFVCDIDVYLTPAAPGTRSGAVVLNDANGNPFATGYVQGVGTSPLATFPGAAPATYASGLNVPIGVTVDESGNILVANSGARNVLLVAPGGAQSQVGSGFSNPTGVAEDGAGNIFVVDSGSVYEIAKTTGIQTQLNIPGLSGPEDLAIDGAGNLYISEPNASEVLRVTPSGVETNVGANLNSPRGLALDAGGNLYIADYAAGSVFVVTPSGAQSTISGFGGPSGVTVDAAGNVYVAVFGSGSLVEVSPGGARTTLASALADPFSVAVDASGNLYFTEDTGGSVQKIDRADAPSLTFATTAVGQVSSDSPQAITLSNAGNAPLTLPVIGGQNNPGIASGYLLDTSAASDCPVIASGSPAPGLLTAGASCLLSISFSPVSAGSNAGSLTIVDNNLNAQAPNYTSQTIQFRGSGQVIQSQTINFPAIATQTAGGTVNLSATASSGLAVSFTSLTPSICMVSGNSASLLMFGNCTIQASQAGNSQYSPAPNVDQSFLVNLANQSIAFPGMAAQIAGGTVNLSATASSGLAVSFTSLTSSVCTVSGSMASLIKTGTCAIQASQAGNNQYSAAPNVSQNVTVNAVGQQSINFPAIAAQTAGTALNLSATASSGLTVSFTSLTPAICTVSGSSASLITGGTCTIEASQPGNSQYGAASNVSRSFIVNLAKQTISFAAIASQNIGTTLNLSATASSGLTVNFSSTTPAVCTVSGDSASLIALGNCSIEASQTGNLDYAAAAPVTRTFKVNP